MHKLFIITGVSGSGKTSLSAEVFSEEQKLITTTSRTIRPGERNGFDYYFVDNNTFLELINTNSLVEYNEFTNGYYGLDKKELKKKEKLGNAYIILDSNGAKRYKELFPKSIVIFIDIDKSESIAHMRARGDKEENIIKRLEKYETESSVKKFSDFIIENKTGRFHESVEALKKITQTLSSLR